MRREGDQTRSAWNYRVTVLAALLLTVFSVFAYQERLAATARVGRPAPNFTLMDQSGHSWELSALRGRVVVLNFWASWCEVCRHEAPALEAFAQRYAGRVTVLGVDWREPQAMIDAYLRQYGVTYPNLRDATGRVARAYGLTGVPETWLIDAGGVAQVHQVGEVTFEGLQAAYASTTGRSLDAPGVGPIPVGGRAYGLAWSGGTLWMATSRGLWATADGARTWSRTPQAVLAHAPIHLIAAEGNRLYAGGHGTDLWTSPDGGRKWVLSDLGLPLDAPPSALATAPDTSGSAWVWVPHAGLFMTDDAGRSWHQVAPSGSLPAEATALAAGPGASLWAATARGVYGSTDGGRDWSAAGIYENVQPSVALASPSPVLTSKVPLAAAGIAVAGGHVFFAGPRGIWEAAGTGSRLAGSPARAFSALTAGPGGAIWALAPNGDAYVSLDTGRTWRWKPYAGTAARGGAA